VGVRIAPSGTFNGMADSNPRALFRYVAEWLNDFELAYLRVIEPRIKGGELIAEGQGPVAAQELSKVFRGSIIAAGGFEPDTAEATVANGDASLIAFGRQFIANPGPAEAHRARSAAQSLRPEHLLRLRCARIHRLPHLRGE
jgi:N-ethylmaleimide reductase